MAVNTMGDGGFCADPSIIDLNCLHPTLTLIKTRHLREQNEREWPSKPSTAVG